MEGATGELHCLMGWGIVDVCICVGGVVFAGIWIGGVESSNLEIIETVL